MGLRENLLAVLTTSIVVACANSARMTTAGSVEPVEVTALEAGYRWLFEYNGSFQQQKAEVYCIGVGTLQHYADPDPVVVGRFAHDSQRVVPVSHCTRKGFAAPCEQGRQPRELGKTVSVREESSCRFGIIFLLANAGRDSTGLRLETTVDEGPLAGEGRTLRLIRERAGWRIEPSPLTWQS